MGAASYIQTSFLGGEISQFAQGRMDKPDYRVSMNVCLNSFPVEIGAWVRRPGSRFAGTSRGGVAARVIKFDFEQASPYTIEFTDGKMRFRSGATLVPTNDDQVVVAVSTANPAVVHTTTATDWLTGDTLVFPGASTPLLENRQFTATKVDTTHFSLTDAIAGDAIDGSTLGALVSGATVARLQELTTAYVGGSWSGVRAVQAETTDILLAGTVRPQALTVDALPTDDAYAEFSITPAVFNDGPYLDPFINGVRATPSAKTGIISLALDFPAYSATKAYAEGTFVSYSGVNYVSRSGQNVGHQPDISATYWTATSAAAAINDGQGFLGSDVGRLVRLFSEPPEWLVGSTYAASTAATPVIVSYNPTGLPGATTYWQSLVGSNTGFAPGSDLTHWQLVPQAAVWSWGRITSLTNTIDRALAGSSSIGDMTSGGGLAAAFDGVFSQSAATSAEKTGAPVYSGTPLTTYVGKNYSGATDQVIQSAIVYPASDSGFAYGNSGGYIMIPLITLNLRGKASAPSSSSDGTLLGTSGTIPNTLAAVTIISSDQTTAWKYVWIEQITSATVVTTYTTTNSIAEVVFFSPSGTGTSTGVNVEILGPPLLYTAPVATWRLGVYSDTTGWPTCGTYHEGRLWLGGAVSNRLDACVSNGIDGGTVDFAPTNQYGTVATSSAISYVLNSDGSNPIFWMQPDLQGIIIGTQAGEWLVQAPTTGPIAPTNIAARRVTKIGASSVEPRRTDNTTVFVPRYGIKMMEYFADVRSGKFSGPNIADKAQHIVRSKVLELAYVSGASPIIWGRCTDGSLFGTTYKRDALTTAEQAVAAFHRHSLGSERTVESLCGGPSVDGELDTLTLVTNDEAGIRHVELLTDTPDELTAIEDLWLLDNAVRPSSTSTTSAATAAAPYGGLTLNGLWHLNDQTVQVFAGGLDCGDRGDNGTTFTDFLVTNGSCFVPYGDGVSAGSGRGLFTADFVASFEDGIQIVVGFTYNSDGQMIRPNAMAETGARNGPAFGKKRRNHRVAMQMVNTRGISVGTTFDNIRAASLRQADDVTPIGTLDRFSGIYEDTIANDYSYDGMICWRVSRPNPAAITVVGGNIQTQDE